MDPGQVPRLRGLHPWCDGTNTEAKDHINVAGVSSSREVITLLDLAWAKLQPEQSFFLGPQTERDVAC